MRPISVCPRCGKKTAFPESDAGRSQMCPHCAGWVQVRESKAVSAPPVVSAPPKTVAPPAETPRALKICPKCGGGIPTGKNRCPGCGAMYSSAKAQKRARLEERGEGLAIESHVMNWGVAGGVLAILAAAIWFFAGLAAGTIFFYPPVLALIGLAAIGKGISSARLKRRLADRRSRKEGDSE